MFAKRHKTSKRAKGIPKAPIIAAYSGIFLFIIALVATGYRAPQSDSSVANAVPTTTSSQSTPAAAQPSTDQLVATNLAADLAETTNLSVAGNVSSMSVSLATQSELAQSDNTTTISKPQILQADSSSRTIVTYTAVAGDTVPSVAARYNISAQTLKWANNLTSDALEVGRQLTVPPIDGVVYTVKSGDTIQSIASKYSANAERITSYNDLELSGATPGQQIIIPSGQLPGDEQPGYVAPRVSYSSSSYSSYNSGYGAYFQSGSVGNRYAPGNCTWYAYERRAELGRPIGSFWGNASTWAFAASSNGYRVDHTPEVGAIAQWNAYQGNSGYAGHVGVVESVNGDGSITISEMNNGAYGGFNIVNRRTLSPSAVSNFIH